MGNKIGNPLIKCPYDVGDILTTLNATAPSTRWPGTAWRAIETMLLGASSKHQAGSIGGEERVTLTTSEMPSHGGHVLGEMQGTAIGAYLPLAAMSNYGQTGRGWDNRRNGEIVPASEGFGGNQAHNNMPPYTAVYIWERTA